MQKQTPRTKTSNGPPSPAPEPPPHPDPRSDAPQKSIHPTPDPRPTTPTHVPTRAVNSSGRGASMLARAAVPTHPASSVQPCSSNQPSLRCMCEAFPMPSASPPVSAVTSPRPRLALSPPSPLGRPSVRPRPCQSILSPQRCPPLNALSTRLSSPEASRITRAAAGLGGWARHRGSSVQKPV